MNGRYFCHVTTLFGIVLTDCWTTYSYRVLTYHKQKELEIEGFSQLLTHDLQHKMYVSEQSSRKDHSHLWKGYHPLEMPQLHQKQTYL